MKSIEKYAWIDIPFASVADSDAVYLEDCATFTCKDKQYTTGAFRQGDHYTTRFSPMTEGEWSYEIRFNGETVSGSFLCTPCSANNHGKVVTNGFQFRYEDGAKYIPFGTTCYAWINQTTELQDKTIETLSAAPFNKIRMCVFPKSMPYNNNEPDFFPFFKREDGSWDVSNPDERFWSNLDHRLTQLTQLGVECDLIVFHPYDRWGFSTMSQEDSMTYLNYCIQRLAPYRNLWWSLANEYETVYAKTMENWDEYGETIAAKDIYHHLISVHDIMTVYPKRDWMTHVSVQSGDIDKIKLWHEEYGMPVMIDECGYEGDLPYGWGNLSAFDEMHCFWWSIMRGGFCTHGETFHREDEVLWWAKGGVLYGESPARIAFLKDLLYSLPDDWKASCRELTNPNMDDIDPTALAQIQMWNQILDNANDEARFGFWKGTTPEEIEGEHFLLHYCGRKCPCFQEFDMKKDRHYKVEVIDAWEMTRTEVLTGVSGHIKVELPAKPGMAILFTEI